MKKIYFSIAFALVILNINCSIAQKQITGNHVSPKVFIENKGQITDQFGNKNSEVQFLYHNGIFNLELKKDGFSYEIFEVQHSSTNFSEAGNNSFGNEEHPDLKVTANRIDVQFEGCNTNATIEATEKIDGYYNFYYAPVNTNRLNRVNAFRKITYKNIYDGIDLTFISPNEKSVTTAAGLPFQNKKPVPLRYEFTVHPGADLSKIKFSYHGAEKLLVNADGNFEATAASSFVNESKPKYFVEGSAVPIEANFEMHNNIKSFSSLEYDHSKFLIIDPNIIWGSYFGGEGGDEDSEIAVDDEGNPVIDGQSFSYEHIATIGAYQTTYNGGVYDWFISKFTTTGELIWSTYFGGDDKDYCYGLEIDHNKNIIAVGNSISKGLATTGAFKDSITGKAADILIAKFSPDGQLLWSTYMGGDSSENARNVVCDSKNDLYLVGTSLSITGIASAGAYQENNGGYDDAWIAKFSQSGDRLWSTFFGDSGVDRSHALTLNSTGFIYMAGTTSSKKGIASTGAHQIVYGGGSEDAFLSKFDSTGQLLWATYYGGALDDRSRGVETDSLGFIYVGGFTNSANNIGTAGTWQPNWAVGYQDNIPTEDAFVAKFNSAGQRKWGTYLGGDNVENLWGMTIDKASKSIYLVGSTTSPFYLSYGSAMQISKSDAADCFISKFTTTGDLAWSTYWGGQVGDQFEDVAVDKNKFIYTCGRAVANDYAVTQDAYQMNFYGGNSDAVLYKFYGGNDCLDLFEPNENIFSAKEIKPWLPADSTIFGINGTIANANDADWYSIAVDAAFPNLMVVLRDLFDDYNLNLYNESGILIYQSTAPDNISDTIAVNNLNSGTYYIEIPHAVDIFDSLTCYRLQFYKNNLPFTPIGIPTTAESNSNSLSFSLYPNPVLNNVSFFIPSTKQEKVTVIIYDLLNRIVYDEAVLVNEGGKNYAVSVNTFAVGAYTLVIKSADQMRVAKFVKE